MMTYVACTQCVAVKNFKMAGTHEDVGESFHNTMPVISSDPKNDRRRHHPKIRVRRPRNIGAIGNDCLDKHYGEGNHPI